MSPLAESFLKITIVHEDTVTGLQAIEVLKRLAAQLGNRFGLDFSPWRFNSQVWKFEWLQDPQGWNEAVAAAVAADMIIIAVGAQGELPASVRSWIESVLPRKQSKCMALVALLSRKKRDEAVALTPARYLRQLAKRHGVDFICNLDPHPQRFESGIEAVLAPFGQNGQAISRTFYDQTKRRDRRGTTRRVLTPAP